MACGVFVVQRGEIKMGKALMVWGQDPSIASGERIPLLGFASVTTNEQTSYSVTEGAAFSGLAWNITAGGSGTNNLRFRINNVDGNQLATRSGFGFAEDAVNTDTVSAGDLVNALYTGDGTNSANIAYARTNVEFASGHGNFHGAIAAQAAVFDTDSLTTYIPLSGRLTVDGTTTIANQQWLVRGYTSVEAFQIYVGSNARVNNTVFRLNINGTAVGTAITYAAGATGLQTVTGMGQSLSGGDLVCVSITTGAGVEDMTVSIVGATFKSTTGKSEVFSFGGTNGLIRTASATSTIFPPGVDIISPIGLTETQARLRVGFACRISNLRTYVFTNTYTGSCTLKLFKNGAEALSLTVLATDTGWHENLIDTVDIDDNDEISLVIVGGTSGTCRFMNAGVTFSPLTSNRDVNVFSLESGWEGQSVDLAQIHNLPITSAESGWEALSADLSEGGLLGIASAESGWEGQSVGLDLDQIYNLPVTSAEYGWESSSPPIVHAQEVDVVSLESGWEALSGGLSKGALLDVDRVQIGWDAVSASLNQISAVRPQSLESAVEVRSVGLSALTGISVISGEFGWEVKSPLIRHFQHGNTPPDRRMLIVRDPRHALVRRDFRTVR